MHYQTRRTTLRPPDAMDHDYLYGLMTHPEVAPHVRFRGTTINPAEFVHAFYEAMLVAHIAEGRRSRRPIGLHMLHGASLVDGYCYLSSVAEPSTRGSGLMMEAGFAFISFALDTWPLRKIYIEAAESTLPQYGSILRRFAVEEGRLSKHAFAEGRFQDVHVLSFTRQAFLDYRNTYLAKLVLPVAVS